MRGCAEAQSEEESNCTLFVFLHYFISEITTISKRTSAELEIFMDRTNRREIDD
jgi:hypothetical protein